MHAVHFWDKGEVYLVDQSVLRGTEKERMQEGKRSIGPRMKYGNANLMTSLDSHFAEGLNNRKA